MFYFSQSNALAKSQKIPAVCYCSLRAVKILPINVKTICAIVWCKFMPRGCNCWI